MVENKLTLIVSEVDVQALYITLRNIAGCEDRSHRKWADSINNKLWCDVDLSEIIPNRDKFINYGVGSRTIRFKFYNLYK